jgi:predicted RNase H-like HicB family nuclease/uncharacterized damage-inducible protein DinB
MSAGKLDASARRPEVTAYGLYLETGPKHRKTMVHVLNLLGCVTVGPTTEEALAATPAAIDHFRRFLSRHGEATDPRQPIEIQVIEHITEGMWLGNGSPYLLFAPDYGLVSDDQLDAYLLRYHWLREALASWAEAQTDSSLDAPAPEGGCTARRILLHVLGASGGYLAAALGSAPGFSRISTAAERGDISLANALRQTGSLAIWRALSATPAERARPRQQPQALRRTLEHDWEHLAELARRPAGPPL